MQNLLLSGLVIAAIIFGCNMSGQPDYKPQGWKPAGPDAFQKTFEKTSISVQGGFYAKSDKYLQKDFCIGSNFKVPTNTKLVSITLRSDGQSSIATWDQNTTLDGDDKYAEKQCGHIIVNWNLDKPQSEIFKQGAEIDFIVDYDGYTDTVTMKIVPAAEYNPE